MKRINCAIYTRKSSDEGLEKEFNSLDAQREACEAYIKSQKHAGWLAVGDLYDDGGLSGGTLERPALLRLLSDIKASKVQIVVVYKVDRLTRSLADFAKIVDVLDAHNASFASVTQSFNTTTSMGRLTLNMLLSFAQFEREIAGERIRDKIAASKAKGMWMGGNVPLGYNVKDRKLIVNETDAGTVRTMFRRYAELGSVRLLREDLVRQGIVSKRREHAAGALAGGNQFSRGALYTLLQNRIYRGEITHREHVYSGQHEAIVDVDLWQIVQDKLAASRHERSLGSGALGDVRLENDQILLHLKPSALLSQLADDAENVQVVVRAGRIKLAITATLRRAGKGIRLVIGNGTLLRPAARSVACRYRRRNLAPRSHADLSRHRRHRSDSVSSPKPWRSLLR